MDPSTQPPTQLIYTAQEPLLVLRSVVIRVIAGPNAGASCTLTNSRVRAGSATDNELVLSDVGVSRHHLEFQVHDAGYLVRDLDSTNGSFYRGARIREALLTTGAELRLGSTVLRLEAGQESTSVVTAEPAFGGLVGNSPAMQKVYGMLAAVAPTEVTVLLQGETGTGKELIAEALHRQSPRHDKTFGVLDCGALPPGLIESELFGHERGAFTGAITERVGIFEKSHGGTVFLDELGELPLELQTRLLRVLEQRTIRRVGSSLSRKVDVRLVAGTNRDLAQEVKKGNFRQDLYYRLAVVCINVPPLRKRGQDILLLARHFLLQAGAADPDAVLTPELCEALLSRRWPGNVRELRNAIERAVVLIDGAASMDDLVGAPSERQEELSQVMPVGQGREASPREGWLARAIPDPCLAQPYKVARELLLQQFETLYFGRLVEKHGNNISAIARDADIDRHVVRRLLAKLGLHT